MMIMGVRERERSWCTKKIKVWIKGETRPKVVGASCHGKQAGRHKAHIYKKRIIKEERYKVGRETREELIVSSRQSVVVACERGPRTLLLLLRVLCACPGPHPPPPHPSLWVHTITRLFFANPAEWNFASFDAPSSLPLCLPRNYFYGHHRRTTRVTPWMYSLIVGVIVIVRFKLLIKI